MAMTKPHFQAEQDAIVQKGDSYIIKPRGLSIVWGNDERYWKLPKKVANGESNDPAELIQVSWLEVTSSVILKPKRKYEIDFEVELAPDAFGWRDIQPFLMAKVGKMGKYKWAKVKLVQDSTAGKFRIPDKNIQPLSIVTSNEDGADNMLYFGLYEVWSGKWKGGLKIHQANVRDVGSG